MTEFNSKNKKIALLGLAVFIILVITVTVGGGILVKNGNLDADASTATAGLKAQLNEVAKPKLIKLKLQEAYAAQTDTEISLKYAEADDLTAIEAGNDDEEQNAQDSTSLKAHTIVYFKYSVEGMSDTVDKGENKYLGFVCEDDIIVTVNNIASDGTAITGDKDGIVSAVTEYANTGLAGITYLKLTEDGSPLADFPESTDGFKACDVSALNKLISVDETK